MSEFLKVSMSDKPVPKCLKKSAFISKIHPGDNDTRSHEHDQAVDGRADGHGRIVQQSCAYGDAQGAVLYARFNGYGDSLSHA